MFLGGQESAQLSRPLFIAVVFMWEGVYLVAAEDGQIQVTIVQELKCLLDLHQMKDQPLYFLKLYHTLLNSSRLYLTQVDSIYLYCNVRAHDGATAASGLEL